MRILLCGALPNFSIYCDNRRAFGAKREKYVICAVKLTKTRAKHLSNATKSVIIFESLIGRTYGTITAKLKSGTDIRGRAIASEGKPAVLTEQAVSDIGGARLRFGYRGA